MTFRRRMASFAWAAAIVLMWVCAAALALHAFVLPFVLMAI